jgi:actin-related protein 5
VNAKTPFDKDVVYNIDLEEQLLDYIFTKLGIDTESINHPILMTECICNPNFAR